MSDRLQICSQLPASLKHKAEDWNLQALQEAALEFLQSLRQCIQHQPYELQFLCQEKIFLWKEVRLHGQNAHASGQRQQD